MVLTSSSKHSRLDGVGIFQVRKDGFALCRCRLAVTFVTQELSSVLFLPRNSLKSHMSRKLKSPFSNIRAVTLKLCTRWSPTAAAIHPLLGSRAPFNFP